MSSTSLDQEKYMAALIAKGPPYPPRVASFGGRPNVKVDVPVSAVLVVIFVFLAITHMTIFLKNKRRNHLFIFSGVTFGFCMSRVLTFSLRIATAKNPTNIGLAIAAGIFVSAGVILLYVINLNYAQRVLRGYHPVFGNKKSVFIAFVVYYLSVVVVLVIVIATTVVSFFTLNTSKLFAIRRIQQVCIVYFTGFSAAPIPIVLAARFIPGSGKQKFGKLGSMSTKVYIVVVASLILTLENSIRAAAAIMPPHPINDPAWYQKSAAFYIFVPMLEIIVVVLYAVTRADKRFFVDGMNKADSEKTVGDTVVEKDHDQSSRNMSSAEVDDLDV